MSLNSSKRNAVPQSSIHVLRPQAMLAAFLIGTTIALAILVIYFGGKKTNFEDAATFGAQTTSVFAKVGVYPIHCADSRDLAACLAGARDRKAVHSVLWLGNSQVHAVNQLQKGETNAVPILFDALRRRGFDLLTFSQPNANLQEHYVLFEYLRRQLPLRVLVLPVVFDDLREEGLRNEIAILTRDDATVSALSETEIGRRLVTAVHTVPQDQDTAGIAKTMQERVERYINLWLEKHSSLWQARPEIRGQLIYGVLYNLRNTLFGIKATSKRKMMPGRYLDNMDALEEMLITAKRNNISVVLYVAPFRGGVENPYIDTEYARFKSDVKILSRRYGAVYENMEMLVPGDLWGTKDATALGGEAEVDFMHFQYGGHKLLAGRLEGLVVEAMASREKEQ
ncbi:MAG: hypothetical protein HY940_05195 [Gammaproteobacteria bacterium]|nr:hypothetical protein [Gammaproteobacteria bacterium]